MRGVESGAIRLGTLSGSSSGVLLGAVSRSVSAPCPDNQRAPPTDQNKYHALCHLRIGDGEGDGNAAAHAAA